MFCVPPAAAMVWIRTRVDYARGFDPRVVHVRTHWQYNVGRNTTMPGLAEAIKRETDSHVRRSFVSMSGFRIIIITL